jgi:hypothetical protein
MKIVLGPLKPAPVSIDGGVQNPTVVDGDIITSSATGGWWENLVGWMRPLKITFRNCQAVPKGGQILVYETDAAASMATEYASIVPDCRVWHPVKHQVANETLVTCLYDNTNGRSQWVISNFDRIEARTVMAFDFKVYWQKANPGAIPMQIGIYHTLGVSSSLTDYTPNTFNIAADTTGAVLAPYSQVLPFQRFANDIYSGKQGFIEFDICLCHTSAGSCTNQEVNYVYQNEDDYLVVSIPNTVTFTTYLLYCEFTKYDPSSIINTNYATRVASLAYADKDFWRPFMDVVTGTSGTDNTLRLIPHPKYNFEVDQWYRIRIGTRNTEENEGIRFTSEGTFAYTVMSYNNGALQRKEKNVYSIFGNQIDNFWVYSANKIRNEDTFIEVFLEWWTPGSTAGIVATDEVVVYFDTATSDGFKTSLKVVDPYPDLTTYPCGAEGVTNNPSSTNRFAEPKCRINYGYDQAPARISLYDHGGINGRIIKIRIPYIRNPDHGEDLSVCKSYSAAGICECFQEWVQPSNTSTVCTQAGKSTTVNNNYCIEGGANCTLCKDTHILVKATGRCMAMGQTCKTKYGHCCKHCDDEDCLMCEKYCVKSPTNQSCILAT